MAIANDVGTINLSLFKNTPLNNSSSHIGEMMIIEIKEPIAASEFAAIKGGMCIVINDSNPGILFIAKIDKYNIPQEKKTLTKTIVKRDFGDILEKIFLKSCLNSSPKNLNLYIKQSITTT